MPARKNFLALSGTGFSVVRMNFEILKNQCNAFICEALIAKDGFLSYYPLKQGLKQSYDGTTTKSLTKFLSYYPLKQGLKPMHQLNASITNNNFYPTIH